MLAGAPAPVVSGFGDGVSAPPYRPHLLDSHRTLLASIPLAALACPPPPTARVGDCPLLLQLIFMAGQASSVPRVESSPLLQEAGGSVLLFVFGAGHKAVLFVGFGPGDHHRMTV